jgi:hypothetical protein
VSTGLKSLNLPPSLERIFARFPKIQPPLPKEYKEIYLQNFLAQRTGGEFSSENRYPSREWNHQRVVREGRPGGRILEIGAGTINHLPLEKDFESYDIVEPMEEPYQNSDNLEKVRAIYPDISAVPADEVEGIVGHFYKKVRRRRFPLPLKHLSFYTYLDGAEPNRRACEDYLAVVDSSG